MHDRPAFALVGTALACLSLAGCAGGRDAGGVAQVSPAPAQQMDNIGASGAWWVNDLARFSSDAQRRVAELLFGPGGLELSAYRYNIGGGGTAVRTPDRAPETFLVKPGQYDWSRDRGGQLFLRYASRYGVRDLIGFVNSAPAVWTSNGQSCGGHLVAGAAQSYATYLADIVTHFDAEGVRINYLSPFNEPTIPFNDCRQEGMVADLTQRAEIIRTLGRTLESRAPYARIIADESSRVDHFIAEAPRWMTAGGAARYVSRLAHHLYDHPSDSVLIGARSLGQRYDKPLWATEICCFIGVGAGWGRQYDPTIVSALAMANIIYRALSIANDSAFHWWVALSPVLGCDPTSGAACSSRVNNVGSNDGLIYYDRNSATNGNQALYMTKRYYALGQYSKFVRPGAVRHDVSDAPAGVQVLAFDRSGTWTLVASNFNNAEVALAVRVTLGSDIHPVGAYRTSATEDLAAIAPPAVAGGIVSATLPGRSITTYLLRQRRG